jgi:hypothetical protein
MSNSLRHGSFRCRPRPVFVVALVLIVSVIASPIGAQLTGTYHVAPGTVGTYLYHTGEYHTVPLPIEISVTFSGDDPTTMLTGVIHKALIGDTPVFNYPIVHEFPIDVVGSSTDGRRFDGDLLGSQYLFQWDIEPAANGGLLLSGQVFWAGGRIEITTITDARLVPGIAGDYNQNGAVDAADYVVWRREQGQTGPGLAADGSGNDVVDEVDLAIWRSRFGETAPPVPAAGFSAGAIPEPATLALFLAALYALAAPRRLGRRD